MKKLSSQSQVSILASRGYHCLHHVVSNRSHQSSKAPTASPDNPKPIPPQHVFPKYFQQPNNATPSQPPNAPSQRAKSLCSETKPTPHCVCPNTSLSARSTPCPSFSFISAVPCSSSTRMTPRAVSSQARWSSEPYFCRREQSIAAVLQKQRYDSG